jgi:hypothetical protein
MEKRLLLIFVALLTVIGSFAQGKYVTVDGLKYLKSARYGNNLKLASNLIVL